MLKQKVVLEEELNTVDKSTVRSKRPSPTGYTSAGVVVDDEEGDDLDPHIVERSRSSQATDDARQSFKGTCIRSKEVVADLKSLEKWLLLPLEIYIS